MAALRKYPKAPKLRLGRLCQPVRAVSASAGYGNGTLGRAGKPVKVFPLE